MELKLSHVYLQLLLACLVVQLPTSTSVFNNSLDDQVIPSNKTHREAFCLPGWVSYSSMRKCFMFVAHSQSWEAAETHCNGNSGHLASVTSFQELSFVQKLCATNASECWVGGRWSNITVGEGWKWSDNTSYWNGTTSSWVNMNSTCVNHTCYSPNMEDFCTLVTNASTSLSSQKCNAQWPFICMLDAEETCHHMHCHNEYLTILAVVSGFIICTTMGVVIWLLIYRRSKKSRKSRRLSNPASLALVTPTWKIFTPDELRSITKNFSEGRLLGDAKTGGTYGGVLPDGSRVVVKKLKRSSFQRKKEFFSEIGRVAKLHHPSLVSVKGCSYDHGERYIVFEFIANGPLDRWLHHVPKGGRSLDWTMRMKVAANLAQGIAFLHDKVKPQVVHRDIRASNVLLDEEFGAHLMGVGLSKFVSWEVMHERRVMAGGTHGYLAPEYVYRNEFTTKSDVYSFGVLLLEIVTGRRPAQAVDSLGWQSIFEWVTPLVQSNRYLEVLDPVLSSCSSQIPEVGIVQKVVDLVYSCTQHVPSMRPRMSHVVHQLQQLAPNV